MKFSKPQTSIHKQREIHNPFKVKVDLYVLYAQSYKFILKDRGSAWMNMQIETSALGL